MEDKKQPIVVKKIIQGHGHHGGSWKVAFADFATAMMAFFMVLWLVGQTDAQKRGGIAEYFQNPSMVPGHSEAPTGSLGPGGAGMSLISFGTSIEVQKADETKVDKIRDGGMSYVSVDKLKEQRRLEALLEKLREEISDSPALQGSKDQMLMEITDDGLRIQVIDKQDRPMFESGSAILKPYTREILYQLAKTINAVPNKITISGHTDISAMSKRNGMYTNWELSSDRANSARRALLQGGLNPDKVGRITGLASTSLLDIENPYSPANRRISILIMKRKISDMIKKDEAIKAIPKELMQQSHDLEQLKNGGFGSLSSDELELMDNETSDAVLTDNDSGLGAGLELHGISKKAKKTTAGSNKNKVDNPATDSFLQEQRFSDSTADTNETEVIVRKKGTAKSFITLPPIIDPSLLPPRDQ